MPKGRILSGMRTTGKMHLGNYVGALENWVSLQDEYENFHLVADWHALTTDYEHTDMIRKNIKDMVTDWLSAGIDPQKSPVFVQSDIKEHAELFLLFSMLVTTARLERNPTVKEQIKDLQLESISYGHLGYPVLQAADILIYKADLVPVGEDQVPHVELTREIARRFNGLFGPVFPEPLPKLTQFARLPGVDGKRMSKSLGNVILLSDSPQLIQKKVMSAVTDPQKIRLHDPGRPEICTVFTYHKKFNPEEVPCIEAECRNGTLGCVEDKRNLARKLSDFLAPFRERRAEIEKQPTMVEEILQDGARRARKVAQATMAEVRDAMKMG